MVWRRGFLITWVLGQALMFASAETGRLRTGWPLSPSVKVGKYGTTFKIYKGDVTVYGDRYGLYGVKDGKQIWGFKQGCFIDKDSPIFIFDDIFYANCDDRSQRGIHIAGIKFSSGEAFNTKNGVLTFYDDKYIYFHIYDDSGNDTLLPSQQTLELYRLPIGVLKSIPQLFLRFQSNNLGNFCSEPMQSSNSFMRFKGVSGRNIILESTLDKCNYQVTLDFKGKIINEQKNTH
ncbi:hypothetical protein [Deinococcus maricopensis]|uniref:Uncharacterized protein n=1 Tax=Deinococcus maricopensis (strain DSM 21211 / LMG 22137 / NRRL B-23946 / LB-34) TaxID=709986 RepID=E8U748_DEIML|nr:hypothetical protein [Deinococcus maricopensis]ADV66887.1 hypothetical protein Deima_1236 [Deinococcus maricopensis DSM 21211]